MRTLRFGLFLALSATAALAGSAACAGGDASAATQSHELDRQLDATLAAMIASAEVGPGGEIHFTGPLGDPRLLEPNSGRYWQVSGEGHEAFASRSLWDRTLATSGRKAWSEPLRYDSGQFPGEPLRVAERTVRLPGSAVEWQFVVAGSRIERE